MPVVDDRLAPVLEDRVEHDLPGEAQDDAADEVGHEEHRAEEVGALELAGEQVGQGEGPEVDRDDGDHRDDDGEPQR